MSLKIVDFIGLIESSNEELLLAPDIETLTTLTSKFYSDLVVWKPEWDNMS